MMDHITQVGDVFMEVLGKKADQGQEVCMFEATQALTMDYIGQAAFGIDTSFQNDPKNPFLVTAQRALRDTMTGPFHVLARKLEFLSDSIIGSSARTSLAHVDNGRTVLRPWERVGNRVQRLA